MGVTQSIFGHQDNHSFLRRSFENEQEEEDFLQNAMEKQAKMEDLKDRIEDEWNDARFPSIPTPPMPEEKGLEAHPMRRSAKVR
jgi:hypothetical protein